MLKPWIQTPVKAKFLYICFLCSKDNMLFDSVIKRCWDCISALDDIHPAKEKCMPWTMGFTRCWWISSTALQPPSLPWCHGRIYIFLREAKKEDVCRLPGLTKHSKLGHQFVSWNCGSDFIYGLNIQQKYYCLSGYNWQWLWVFSRSALTAQLMASSAGQSVDLLLKNCLGSIFWFS